MEQTLASGREMLLQHKPGTHGTGVGVGDGTGSTRGGSESLKGLDKDTISRDAV